MSERMYYWLQLPKDFFNDMRIKKLRRIAGGDKYTIIYQQMLLEAMNTDGYLYYEGIFSSFAEEFAFKIDEEPADVSATMIFLQQVGYLQIVDGGNAYYLPELEGMVGHVSSAALRQRKKRERDKEKLPTQDNLLLTQKESSPTLSSQTSDNALQCHTQALQSNGQALQCHTQALQCHTQALQCHADVTTRHTEKEKEIEKEIDNINISKDIYMSDSDKSESDFKEEFSESERAYYKDIVNEWNTLSSLGVPAIRSINPGTKRAKLIRTRIKQNGKESFFELVEQIRQSDFLQGRTEKPFLVDFDWAILPTNYQKILEGKYRNREQKPPEDLNITVFPKVSRNGFNTYMQQPATNWDDFESKYLDN